MQTTLKDRLMSKVEQITESGCWIWMGRIKDHSRGYGSFADHGRRRYAHVVSYELYRGPIPAGLELDHICRVRCCVNPFHLEPVTHAENVRRGKTGESQRRKTHCPYGHPYTGDNLIISRGQRICRTCRNRVARRLRRRHVGLSGPGTPRLRFCDEDLKVAGRRQRRMT
jgi:hypothetical protein